MALSEVERLYQKARLVGRVAVGGRRPKTKKRISPGKSVGNPSVPTPVLAFSDDYAAILSEAGVPPAALVGGARNWNPDRMQRARRHNPLRLHAVAVACALGVARALGRGLIAPGREVVGNRVGRLAETFAASAPAAETAAEVNAAGGPLALAVGCCLLVAPLVAYLVLSDD